MKNLNNIIKSFDYSETHIRDFSKALPNELKKMPVILLNFPKGRAIYRCRRHESMKYSYFFEKDISYRTDIENIKEFGRCNLPHSSKFYGSVDSQDIQQGHVVAVFETSPILRNGLSGGIERYTIGKWIAKKDIEFVAIKPPAGEEKDSDIYRELLRIFSEKWVEKGVSEEQKEFYELLGVEFSKQVTRGESFKYSITAHISEYFLSHHEVKGIIYPSVQANSKGLNVVMNPVIFDQCFEIDKILIGDLFVVGKESFFNNTKICLHPEKYPFMFEDLPAGQMLNAAQIIEFFKILTHFFNIF